MFRKIIREEIREAVERVDATNSILEAAKPLVTERQIRAVVYECMDVSVEKDAMRLEEIGYGRPLFRQIKTIRGEFRNLIYDTAREAVDDSVKLAVDRAVGKEKFLDALVKRLRDKQL